MRLRSSALPLAAAFGLLWPALLSAADAVCSLPSSSLADSLLNPPSGEDTDFFVTSGGVPNVALFLDTSESMIRVGPDGAGRSWGSFEVPGSRYGCSNAYARELQYQSSCGRTTWDGELYDPTHEYRNAAVAPGQYCPSMDQAGSPTKTDRAGFDPDFADLFSRNRVYRDANVYLPPGGSGAWTPLADGWTSTSTNPAAGTDENAFCTGKYGTDPAKRDSCVTCLTTKGYFFDGDYLPWNGRTCGNTADCSERGLGMCVKDSGTPPWLENSSATEKPNSHCRIPQVWFTGNYLNFHPPKFVIARKSMKDVLAQVKLIRLGLFMLQGAGGAEQANALGGMNPSCNQFGGTSHFFSNRNAIKNHINNNLSFTRREAALSESLLDLGHLYASRSLTWFGPAYDDANFEEPNASNQSSVCYSCQRSSVIFLSDGSPTSDGMIPDAGFAATPMTAAQANTAGTYAGAAGFNITEINCPTCETASEVADADVPDGTCHGQQLSGACNGAGNAIRSYLPKVAWYLHNVDLRVDAENDYGGYAHSGKQTIDVYAIGLGVRNHQSGILQHTADAGGGKYYNANGGNDLRRAIDKALEEVNTRSIAFGSSSLSTLQASASQGVLIPRFTPSKSAVWDGHLYAFDLWSEFTGGCSIPVTGASNWTNGDYDCDGKCTSVFLREKGTIVGGQYVPGAFIREDATGAFVRNNPADRAPCGTGNKCTSCGLASTTPATPWWDAGDLLSPLRANGTAKPGGDTAGTGDDTGFTSWSARKIYTAIDANDDGKLTAADGTILLSDSTTRVRELLPYLNLQGNDRFCDDLAERLRAAGDASTADAIRPATLSLPNPAGKYEVCAKVVIRYAMGADVFNERKCSGYPTSLCTRPYQLGDVFHSSPVEVWPPLPSDGLLCSRGLHPQCLPSLYSSSIDGPSRTGKANAYDDYAKSDQYRFRNKFALVGANDGMLHAILTGVWHADEDDPRTAPKEDRAPYRGFHDAGTGEELWAFVPPDLLAKLHLLLGGEHHFFVDGTPMVRDVWIDGGINDEGNRTSSVATIGTPNKNRIREGSEFFTVAVVGERRGGNHYFALDVTDGADPTAGPRFMWLYPQPDDRAQLAMGETYSDFAPTPPPIGPVRIDAGAPAAGGCSGGAKAFTTGSGANTCFEERWIVFLSGGFDPQYTRGRGVHMVDLGSGDELFDFSQPAGDGSQCTTGSDPRCHLNYPVAATVGMTMWGKTSKQLNSVAAEGYFDTATFGDTGGQLWVLRFSDPGVINATTKKVENWLGARVFQGGLSSTTPGCGTDFCGTQPFFHITANLPLRATGLYRVLAGTGDRYNLLGPAGGVCSPTNLRACLLKGCTVTLNDGTSTAGPGASFSVDSLGTDAYGMTHEASCASFDATKWVHGTADAPSSTCSTATQKISRLRISCPSTAVCNGSTTGEVITKDISVVCTNGLCEAAPGADPGWYVDLKNDTEKKNWFFSIRVFDETGPRQIFSTDGEALAYDQARLSEADLTDLNAYDAGTTGAELADPAGTGWKYFFDHGMPNATGTTVSLDSVNHYLYRSDERVASSTAVEASCAFWNTLQVALPTGAFTTSTDCPANSPCKAGKRQVSYLYGASPGTGGKCLYVDGTLQRNQQSETIVPPHIGKLVAYVASGQVSFGLTSVRIPQGGTNISLGEAQDITSIVEILPVDRDMHECRHASRTGPAPANCK